jgi:integrase
MGRRADPKPRRLTVTRYYGPDGRQCPKGTPGAVKKREKTLTYFATLPRGPGERPKRTSLGTSVLSQAWRELNRLMDLHRSGQADGPGRWRDAPLEEHARDYEADSAARGNDPETGRAIASMFRRAAAGCGWAHASQMLASDLSRWLLQRRRDGQFGISTSNHYLAAAKAVANWMVRERRLGSSPFAAMRRLNEDLDVRRPRRALTPEEMGRLLSACAKSGTYRSLSGPDRRMLYLVAAMTGLRSSELASLTPESYSPGGPGGGAALTVAAGYSKRRRTDLQPVPADLDAELGPWLKGRPPGRPLWKPRLKDTSKMIRHDLALAGVPFVTPEGQADFHALRHTYITDVVDSGVHPKEAQALARHSTVQLTLARYAHLDRAKTRAAADRLKRPPEPKARGRKKGRGKRG